MLSAADFRDLVTPASEGRSRRRRAWSFGRGPRGAQVESEADSVQAISRSNAVVQRKVLAGWMGSAPWIRLRERSSALRRSVEVGAARTSLEPEDGLTQTFSEDNLVDLLCSGPTHYQRPNTRDVPSAAGSSDAGKVSLLRRTSSIHSDLPDFGTPASAADLLSVIDACRHPAGDEEPPVSPPSTPSESLSSQRHELPHADQTDECGDCQAVSAPGCCSQCRRPLIKGGGVHFALDRAFCSQGCRHQHLECLRRLEQRDCGHSVATWTVETNRRMSQTSVWPVHYRGP